MNKGPNDLPLPRSYNMCHPHDITRPRVVAKALAGMALDGAVRKRVTQSVVSVDITAPEQQPLPINLSPAGTPLGLCEER